MIPIVSGWSVHGPILGLARHLEQRVRLGGPLTITAERERGTTSRFAVPLTMDANGPGDDPHR